MAWEKRGKNGVAKNKLKGEGRGKLGVFERRERKLG